MIDYKVFEQPKALVAESTERQIVYYPKIVDLQKMNTRQLMDAIANLGSSSYSRGELAGVANDLGRSIAQMLTLGNKVYIAGLGTFTPKLLTSQKNVVDSQEINKRNFTCTVRFKADEDFMNILATADWNKVTNANGGASSSTSYKMTWVRQDGSANLKFTAPEAIMSAWTAGVTVTAKLNGSDVAAGNISLTSGGLFLNNVIPADNSLANATVIINVGAVTAGAGTDNEKTYPAGSYTFKNVSQTGPTGGQGGGANNE